MAKLSEEKILDLKSRHGFDLRHVETPLGELVFKPPTRQAWDKYQDSRLDKVGEPSKNARELAQGCLCMPDYSYEQFVAVLDAKPAILQMEIMTAIGEMAGSVETFTVSKL